MERGHDFASEVDGSGSRNLWLDLPNGQGVSAAELQSPGIANALNKVGLGRHQLHCLNAPDTQAALLWRKRNAGGGSGVRRSGGGHPLDTIAPAAVDNFLKSGKVRLHSVRLLFRYI